MTEEHLRQRIRWLIEHGDLVEDHDQVPRELRRVWIGMGALSALQALVAFAALH